MQYKTLPKTNLKVSAINLGTMMFGAQTSEADALAILDYCHENGVNFIDTADMYNAGESERIVGKSLKGRRDEVVLATKVGYPVGSKSAGLSRRYILSAMDDSLTRLGTDYVDIYYLHAPDYATDLEETLQTMDGLVRAGKTRYIGVSNYAAWQIMEILHLCDKRGYIPPVITQNVYNPITRGVETELIPFLETHGIGMTVFNAIAGGFLAGKHKRGTQPAENTRFSNNPIYKDRYWTDANFDALDSMTAAAQKQGMTILQFTLKWLTAQKAVTSILSGVSRLEQIQQNVAALDCPDLTDEAFAVCDEAWHMLTGNRYKYNR